MRSIDIAKLKESINVLLDSVIESGVDFVEIKDQYYWEVGTNQRYNMQGEPRELVLGDLFDDLEFVEAVLSRKESSIPYTLTEAAPLLLYVGEVVSGRLSTQDG